MKKKMFKSSPGDSSAWSDSFMALCLWFLKQTSIGADHSYGTVTHHLQQHLFKRLHKLIMSIRCLK